MSKQIQAVHIPASYTKTTHPESFDPSLDIPHSHCTWHTLISSNLTPSDSISAGIAVLPPDTGNLCPHRHQQAEIYYIISGSCIVTVDGIDYVLEAGSTFFMPGNAEHGIRNISPEKELRWLYVFPTGNFGDVVYQWSNEKVVSLKAKL